MIYGKHPEFLGRFDLQLTEVMYYLYLPISIGHSALRVPKNLYCCMPLIEEACGYAEPRNYRHVYISARKGWATPDNPLNRPGWHCDGFGTDDTNFVWWDGAGTRFAVQPFEGIVSDHNRSMTQFDEQVDPAKVVTYDQHGLYVIDPLVVHSTPVIDPPGHMRQYVKISMSDHQYNLENNSHNYLFDYRWEMHPREAIRNDPHKAQNNHY